MAEQIVVLDEGRMLEKIQDFPNQLEKAWTSLWVKDVPVDSAKIENVLIAGMGGSGIAGLLLKDVVKDSALKFIDTWADYGLPAWVNEKTLVIAVSFSGDTEETIDAVKKAVERKAQVIAITSGGKLSELASIHGFGWIKIQYDSQPRAALGWLYGLLLTLTTKLGLTTVKENTYFQALAELKKTVQSKIFFDKAEELAISLNNKVPMIFAHPPLVGVAKRWANQLNENSKSFVLFAASPELCHNLINGIENPIPEKLMVLYVESKFGFSRNNARKKVLEKYFEKQSIPFVPLSVKSGSLLAEQWMLLYFGDLLSFYLAGVYGVDPTPIEAVKFLKSELEKL